MISLESQEKGPKTLRMSSALFSTTKRKYYFLPLLIIPSEHNCSDCRSLLSVCFFLTKGRATRRWNFLVVRVTFCSRKHIVGFGGSFYCDMGDILLIMYFCFDCRSSFSSKICLTSERCKVIEWMKKRRFLDMMPPHIPIERHWASGFFFSDSKYKHGRTEPTCSQERRIAHLATYCVFTS